MKKLKPFDKVLARKKDDGMWVAGIFSHIYENDHAHFYIVNGENYRECIPYQGNEHLLGTEGEVPQEPCFTCVEDLDLEESVSDFKIGEKVRIAKNIGGFETSPLVPVEAREYIGVEAKFKGTNIHRNSVIEVDNKLITVQECFLERAIDKEVWKPKIGEVCIVYEFGAIKSLAWCVGYEDNFPLFVTHIDEEVPIRLFVYEKYTGQKPKIIENVGNHTPRSEK